MGYAFKEIIVDQHFAGKWTDVDMNLGGHGTFQGTKFSDSAGGFSYKPLPSPKQIMQNRFIYWRVLNDTLEMTEVSMDTNLEDHQVRIIFRDSPIVSPVSIHETEENVIILVVTVSSINRFIFTHPNKLFSESAQKLKNKQPSIFQQAVAKPLMNIKNFPLFEHAINVLLPIAASSHILPQNLGFIFALSYESGSVNVFKVGKEDELVLYDLRQANLFAKILSFTALARPTTSSNEAVIGLNFFTAKIERNRKSVLFLVALTMNGHIRLYICNNLKTLNDWSVYSDLLVDTRFANGFTDCNMILRRSYESEKAKEYPKFVVFVPGEGFKLFQTVRQDTQPPQLVFMNVCSIDFKDKSVMDFCVTPEFLFVLVSNPDEETDWEVKTYNLRDTANPRFNLALLEDPVRPDIMFNSSSTEPQEFYCDLIFNKCSFSAVTIYRALSMFQNSAGFQKFENDWEKTKEYALQVLDSEVRVLASSSDEALPDDDVYEINFKHYLDFYNSCVEYHINTVKPMGIFYETNTHLVCIVKKSRISFLRPTDTLETMFYFPKCISLPEVPEPDDNASAERSALIKYLEIIEMIELTMEEPHKFKIEKRLRENRQTCMSVWDELAVLLTEADPHSETLERRHFIPMLTSKLRELGDVGEPAMTYAINCICSWELDAEANSLNPAPENDDNVIMDDRGVVTEFYMGSRLGANITYGILKQLMNHRYMIARNTLILQSIITKYFSQNNINEGVQLVTSVANQLKAQATFLRSASMVKLFDRNSELIKDSWVENGLKVAHLLNCSTADHLDRGKLTDYWPIKLIELFCHSSLGGLAIRSRVNPFTSSLIVSYADAAGRAIWPSDDSVERPFEEFLISAGQYNALSHYAESKIENSQLEMFPNAESDKSILRKFYNAVADFFVRTPQRALGRFLTITPQQLDEAPYFCGKILGVPLPSEFSSKAYYEKVIHLFQIFGFTSGVQQVAEKALAISNEDRWIRILSVLGFKSALTNGDYKGAYSFITRMPDTTVSMDGDISVGKEKESSVRTFVTQILENGDIDVLVSLKTEDRFYNGGTIREEIEKVLYAQAKLSDPLADESVYQMVYFYHLGCRNFKKAAWAMLERVTQIGFKGHGRSALETQRDAYLDILTCISLVEDEADVDGNDDPEDWLNMLRNAKIECETEVGTEPEVEVFAGKYDIIDTYGQCHYGWKQFAKGREEKDIESVEIFEYVRANTLPEPYVLTVEEENEEKLSSYERILRECELCISLLLIQDDRDVEPIKMKDERNRAERAIMNLTMVHQYDQAVKLAGMWGLSYVPIIRAFAMTCVNLVYEVLPPTGDLADYVRHLDVSELPNANYSVSDMAFLALKQYVFQLEKPMESAIHKEVTLALLAYQMSLPRWLLDSYKKRDVSQLIICYTRFGDWEEATNLCIDVIDAALGRRDSKEFDPSIETVTPHLPIPIIPYNAIEDLANQMNAWAEEKPELEELVQNLKMRCDDYVIRVIETGEERQLLYNPECLEPSGN